jgi:copper(I)-binding protein
VIEVTMKGFAVAALITVSVAAHAQHGAEIDVKSAWARPTVAGQMGTGAFMHLTSKDGARLIGASSAVAGVVEIHEMAMDGNVMRMRPIRSLDLPPGSTIELKPGGHHMMLMDLKRPLATGEKIKVELQLETRDKKLVTQPIEIEVRPRAP